MDATPTSWPHLVKTPHSVSLETELPAMLHIPIVSAPWLFAFLIAANVSAVSPDREIAITTAVSYTHLRAHETR